MPANSPSEGTVTGRRACLAAGLIAFVVIAAALVIERLGYPPCPLCLTQRWPYYLGVPLALLAAAAWPRLPRPATILVLLALAGLFAWGLGLAVYHAGAEWRFWLGPADCAAGNSGASPGDVGGLMAAIESSTVVSCTDPSLRILGLSLAGWNAVVMAALLALVLWGLARVVVRSR